MRSIKGTLLSIILLLFIVLPVFAQLPDPCDPTFLPKYHILHPKEVVKNHVRSCKVFQDGRLFDTILYDSEGYVLSSNDLEYNFTILNEKGLRKEEHLFSSSHIYVGKKSYEYTPYGDPLKSFAEQVSLIGRSTTNTQYEYANGLLSKITMNYRFDMTYVINSSTTIKTFFYDDKRKLSRVETKMNTSSLAAYGQTNEESSIIIHYKNDKPIREVNPDVELKYYYNEKGQLDHIDAVYEDGSSFVEICNEIYTYNDHDLVSLRDDQFGNAWTYEYEYIKPVKFNLMISNEFKQISLWNHSLNTGRQSYPIEKDIVRAKVYTPFMELYAVQLTPQLILPVIFKPGETVTMSASNKGIQFADTDTTNLMILEIEGAIQQAFTIFNQEKASEEVAKFILQQMETYPNLPSYLFYTKYWDIINHKQHYLDYTERMINKFPRTYKVNEAYASLRK
jgi:hypothetical protein